MKLSTRIKKYSTISNDHAYPFFDRYPVPRKIVLMVDCKHDTDLETYSVSHADALHNDLVKRCHCTLLPTEGPVINGCGEIIYHYTSTTYAEWCHCLA